jgi:hypothetical protein
MSVQWASRKRRKVETGFSLLTEAEAITVISRDAAVSCEVARAALLSLEPYENSEYFRSDDVARWIERNARRFAAQARGT